MQQQVKLLRVTSDEHGQRLDNYLLSRLKGVPKSAVYRIVRKGEVRVNKGRAKPDSRLKAGDLVRLPPVRVADPKQPPLPSQKLVASLESSILFDDSGLVVINKPSGMAVHGGSGVSLGLIEALRQLNRFPGFLELVHRLDRDTSGCIMIARKRRVLNDLQDMLRNRQGIKKTYVALVQGKWPKHQREVNLPLLRTLLPNKERIVRPNKNGKPSLTTFRILKHYKNATLVEACPITGRTHQIRVHAKHVGCPLVGDLKYGDTDLNKEMQKHGSSRLFLHAKTLSLSLENKELQVFSAPLPAELQKLLDLLE